jgi:hypothetical protein
MATAKLVFEGQTFQIAWRSLVSACELFVKNIKLLKKPYQVRSRASEANFRLFLAAIAGSRTEIGMENAIDIESLSAEFQFVDLGSRVAEFVSQHRQVEVVRLKSAMLDLQRQLVGQNRSGRSSSETAARRDVGGRGELAGGRPRGEQ